MTEEPIYDKIEKEVFSDAEGSVKWASTSKMPLYDDKGVLIGTYGITRDITAEMQAKEELKDSDEKFHQLSRRAPGFLYLHKVEKDGTVSFPFVSEGIKDILELEPEALEDSMKPLIGRVHKDDIKRVIKEIQESVRTKRNGTASTGLSFRKKDFDGYEVRQLRFYKKTVRIILRLSF